MSLSTLFPWSLWAEIAGGSEIHRTGYTYCASEPAGSRTLVRGAHWWCQTWTGLRITSCLSKRWSFRHDLTGGPGPFRVTFVVACQKGAAPI